MTFFGVVLLGLGLSALIGLVVMVLARPLIDHAQRDDD